jgi:tetratricopeptide (TPR) repeat protein
VQAKALSTLDPAKAHYLNGRLAEKKKDMETAEKEYRGAIDASHGSALTWFNLALFYRHQQRWDDMEDAINHAVSAQMDRPEILMESGEILLRSGRNYPAAVKFLRRYLALNSKVEEAPAFKAHYLLGTALEKQGDTQAAAQEYRAALSLAKGFSRAQEALDRLNR